MTGDPRRAMLENARQRATGDPRSMTIRELLGYWGGDAVHEWSNRSTVI